MADSDTTPENAEVSQEQAQAGFALQRVYVKDLSFESPNSPMVFQKQVQHDLKMDLNTKNKKVADGVFEVVVSVTLTATVEEMTAYIAEVQQAGICVVQGLEGGALAQTLNAFVPNLLFPYLRETVDCVLVKGSFPPAMLAPVNFDAMFAQAVQQRKKELAEAAESEAGESTAH